MEKKHDTVSNRIRPFISENAHWVFFGYGTSWPKDKCSSCLRLIESLRKPNRHAIDCWKLELFFSNSADPEGLKAHLLEEAQRDPTLSGKWLKEPITMSEGFREKLTSVPRDGHPDRLAEEDGVILIYTQSIAEREQRRLKFLNELRSRSLYNKQSISYRRGCLNFDEIIGPWKTWWPVDRDYEE